MILSSADVCVLVEKTKSVMGWGLVSRWIGFGIGCSL